MQVNAEPEFQELPHDTNAEAGVLAIMLTNASGYSRVSDRLEPEYFHYKAHQEIFATIAELSAQGKSITPVTVNSVLPADVRVGDMNGQAYLLHLHLQGQSSSIIHAVDYADIIRDRWARRKILSTAQLATGIVRDPKAGEANACINTVNGELSEVLAALSSDSIPMDMTMAAEAADRIMDGNAGEHERGIPLPFRALAEVLQDDLMPGQLYGLLGASGEGKTSLILPVMRHAAEQGHPVALMSFDQDPRKCINQLASQALKIEEWRIRRGEIAESQKELLREERERISKLMMSVILCPKQKIEGVLSKAQRFVDHWKRYTIKAPLIVIDHIKAITDHDWRADAGSKASHKNSVFKDWAKLNGAAAMMINQRNSQGMKVADGFIPRPTAFDLYGGEAAKEDYDTILGMFRGEWWRDETLKRVPESDTRRRGKVAEMYGKCDGVMELSLVKARHGNPRVTRNLKFVGEYTRVSEFETDQGSMFDGGIDF